MKLSISLSNMKTIISLLLWAIISGINGINAFRSFNEFVTVAGVSVIILLLGDDK